MAENARVVQCALNFQTLMLTIKDLVTKHKFLVKLTPYDCGRAGRAHQHIGLRFLSPDKTQKEGVERHLTLWEAIALVRCGKIDQKTVNRIQYSDEEVSHHAIAMASEFLDWLDCGFRGYVAIRFALLEALSISAEDVRRVLTENNIPVAGC